MPRFLRWLAWTVFFSTLINVALMRRGASHLDASVIAVSRVFVGFALFFGLISVVLVEFIARRQRHL